MDVVGSIMSSMVKPPTSLITNQRPVSAGPMVEHDITTCNLCSKFSYPDQSKIAHQDQLQKDIMDHRRYETFKAIGEVTRSSKDDQLPVKLTNNLKTRCPLNYLTQDERNIEHLSIESMINDDVAANPNASCSISTLPRPVETGDEFPPAMTPQTMTSDKKEIEEFKSLGEGARSSKDDQLPVKLFLDLSGNPVTNVDLKQDYSEEDFRARLKRVSCQLLNKDEKIERNYQSMSGSDGKPIRTCTSCGKGYSDEVSLRLHRNIHYQLEKFETHLFNTKPSYTEVHFIARLRSVSKKLMNRYLALSKRFPSIPDSDEKSIRKCYPCCSKSYPDKHLFQMHRDIHYHLEKLEAISDRLRTKAQAATKTKKKRKSHSCSMCEVTFTKKRLLRPHMYSIHGIYIPDESKTNVSGSFGERTNVILKNSIFDKEMESSNNDGLQKPNKIHSNMTASNGSSPLVSEPTHNRELKFYELVENYGPPTHWCNICGKFLHSEKDLNWHTQNQHFQKVPKAVSILRRKNSQAKHMRVIKPSIQAKQRTL